MQAEGYEQDKLLPFLTKAQNGVEVPPVNSILTDGMPQLNIPASAEDDFRWRTITPSQIPVMPRSVAAPSKPAYRGASLVDFLKSQGMDSSKAARKKLAEEFRVQNYDFSAAKNLELLGKLYDVNEDEEMAAQIFRQAERVRGTQQPARTGAAPQTRTAAGPQNKGRKISPEEFNRRLSMMVGFDVTQGVPADRFKINAPKLSLTPKVQYDKFSLVPRMEYKGLKFGPSKPATQPAVQPAQQQQSTAPVAQPAAVNNTGFRFDLNPTAKPNPNALFNFNPLGLTYPTARTNNATPVKSRPVANVRQQTKPAPVDKPWYEDAWDAVSGTVSEAWDDATDFASDAWDNTSSAASQAWNAAGNTLNSWWDAYSKAVNENPILSRASFTMSPAGIHPQGAINMTRDLTSNILGVFSDDLAQKYNNWSNRQQAFRNMGDESKSRVIVPPYNYAPMYMTGDTIPDGNRQYHLPESMDVNALRFGVRNRGDFNPIQTEAASITSFHPFVDAKNYFSEATEDPANATYLGVSPDGRLQIGGRKDFEGKDVKVSRVFSNKVVDFVREPSGAIKKVPAGAKVNRNAFSPAVTVINDEGKTVQGKLNLALPQGEKGDEAFGVATGGRFILQTPDGQTRLVSGSLKNIEEEFKRIKGNNPYVNVISLDNGSFSRGLRTRDQRLTAQDLRGYDNLNTSGGNFAYLLPNQIKSRPEAKFAEFEKEATRILQSKYPGRRVEVRFQQDGLYDKKGGRDISSQEDIQKEGNSQTKVSLHNFGAARDYQLVVDGKVINPNTNRDLYKEILWTAADNTGTYHLEDWDPVHISLAKEGQKTAFDELKAKYPELLNTETFKKNLEFIKQRKDQDEEYRVLYELMTNFQPFTGKPRTVAPKKKAFGGYIPKAQTGLQTTPYNLYDGIPNPNVRNSKILLLDQLKQQAANEFIAPVKSKSIDFMEKWMASPMYKQMLESSTSDRGADLYEIQRENEVRKIKNSPFSFFVKDLGPITQGEYALYKSGKGEISINKSIKDKDRRNQVGVHEVSHATDAGGKYIPTADVERMKKHRKAFEKQVGFWDDLFRNRSYVEYIQEPTETRARLNTLRYIGKEKGIYDPFTQKINLERLKKFGDAEPLDQLRTSYTDEQIVDMLNSISRSNLSSSDNIFVAAFGGETPKFQTGGEKVKFKNRSGRVIELDTASPRYKRLYNEGIGRWQRFDPATKTWVSSNESDPNAEFVSSPKTLAEVVVTAKAKPNTVGSYSSAFYKQNPYEAFFKNRYNQLKDEFTSQPQWAQSAVGGWGRDSRQQNIRDQINQEYQQQYIDFVSQNLQKRSPQGNQRRDKWLSGKNFTDKELGFLTGSTNLPQPSLWAQGLQGAYNVADMVSLGQLPEENMPGIAKAEVSQYNNPLLALSPLSIPSKMVQSAYKDNYTFKDALAGRPNNASVEEDFLTDPLTYATFGAKGIISAAPRVGRFMSKIGSKAQFLNNRVPAMSGVTGDLSQAANRIDYVLSNPELAKVAIGNVERGNKTILEEGKKIYDDLSSAEGIRRLKEQFRLANPDFNENQLQWLVANRLNEVNDAIRLNQNRFFLEYGKGADNTPTEGAFRTLFPVWNAHFSGYNPFPNIYDVKLPANLFPQKNILGSKSGATNINLVKNTGFENFADPNYRPGSISLGEGLESNVRVLDHEIGHSLQNLGEMPIDHQLLDLMKPKTDLDRLWNMLLPKQSKNDLKYFRFSGGRTYDNEPYPFLVEQRRRMIEDGILSNRYDKVNFAKLLQARINAFKNKSDYANYVEGNRLIKFTPPWKWGKLSSIMNTAPASVPVVGGAAYLASQPGEANLKKKGGPVIDPRGQWAYPGKRTIVPTPTGKITMKGVPYPVYGQDETGFGQMMFPGGEYQFPGQMVDEMPMMRKGGQKKGCPPGFVNIDGKCFDRTSKEYETLYKGGIGYLDKDGTLVSSKTNLPEIVVLPKSTRAFVDDQNFTPSQQYAFEQMGKKYGFPKVRSQKEYADTMPYSPFSKGSAHYWDDTIYADDMQGYMKELAHHVQRDGQIPKWIFNDLPAYIKGKDPYEMPGTVEHTAHSVIEPRLHKEFDKYWDKYILEHRPLEGFEDPKFRRDQMQKAWQNYKSPAKMKKGGQHGGLDRWFAEKWVDVKTGKPCGRQEGENRAYPACRPSRRVSSETPKTASEMSPAEKAKFKRSKTSSERINYNHKRMQEGGMLPQYQMRGQVMSTADSVRHQANKILQYEQLQGGPGGTPLPHYSDSSYMNMLMNDIYPQVRTLFPNATAMEAAEAMDFIFNAGRDPRIYMLDQYLRSKGQAGIPNRGSFNIDMNKDPQKWAKKKPELDALWNQYASEINNLPVNTRRQFLNKGRDWYYQNINNPSPGVPSSDYYDTWYGRIWNTNDFQPFNPNNPNFKPKKK